jgi:hypothetical protein
MTTLAGFATTAGTAGGLTLTGRGEDTLGVLAWGFWGDRCDSLTI